MTPYYDEDGITIYHGDCREIAQFVQSDVVVTDPPYGIGMVAFNDSFIAGAEGFDVCSGQRAAVFHSPRRVLEFVNSLTTWGFERLLWMHKSADLAHPWHGWHMNSEAVAIFSRDAGEWPTPTTTTTDMYSVGPWERAGHPNGKPLWVVVDLILKLSHLTDTVIDPFMGSGTTLRAAKDLGRKAIGIEIEERYCEIAAKRLRQRVLDFSA